MNLLLFIFVLYILEVINGEHCNGSHMTLYDMDDRVASNDNYCVVDGYLTSGWYDVGIRNMLTDPTGLKLGYSCGARWPIWMNGSVPKSTEGRVNRSACTKGPSGDCDSAIEIEVINCGTHMLYKLSATSPYWTAYCFDDGLGSRHNKTCTLAREIGFDCRFPYYCPNGYCDSGYKCTCLEAYYDSNGVINAGGTCIAKVGLGSNCTQPDSCADANAVCSNGNTCICGSGYYDSNGVLNAGGICMQNPCFKPDSATVRPELYYTTETNQFGRQFRKPRLQFWCDFRESQEDNLFYSIAWYINDVFFKQEDPELYASRDKTNLREDELIARNYKLNITVKCTVRTRTSVCGFLGNHTASTGYWMGVQVIKPNVNLQQGNTAIVQFRATFPFGCYTGIGIRDLPCLMSIQMYVPNDTYSCANRAILVKDNSLCGARLPGLTYTELLDGKNYTNVITNMTITTSDPDSYNPGRNRFVLKLVTEGTLVNDIIGGNYLTDVTVMVQETSSWQRKECYFHVDSNMRTFDGKYYKNYNDGDFIMYRHRSEKQEVQIRIIRSCGRGVTCACAVAIRAGGDLFIINICSKPRLISFVSCAESILQVTRMNPNLYKVLMPLGSIVDITIWSDVYLYIDIYPSVKDADETLGLCGLLNNNQGDDFKLPSGLQEIDNNVFLSSWRISSSSSFFSPLNFKPTLWDEGSYFCACPAALNTTTPPTTAFGDRLNPLCSASLYLSCTKKVINQGKLYPCNVRTKRSEISRTRELERISIKQSTDPHPVFEIHRLQKRQTKNYTLEEALALCTRIFDANCTTTAFEGSLPENSKTFKDGSLSNCALDIMYIGDSSLANVHCESYRSAVDEEISRNSIYRKANPVVVSSFRSTACISNCNFHGDCINGTCFCHESYIEEDCSVSLNVSPEVDDTFNGGLCKRDDEDCCGDKPIYGIYFVDEITKQKSERFQRYADGTETVLETIISKIPVKNKYEGTMNIPCYSRKRSSTDSKNYIQTFVSGVRVYLTNDGKNYGSPRAYFIYDSRCQGVFNAADGYMFYLMNGTCFIDDVCYNDGNQEPSDSCKTCQSSVDPYTWTDGCTTIKKNPPSSPDNLILIVASVVSAVLGLAMLVVTAIVIIKCCFKKEMMVDGNIQSNIMPSSPGHIKFHESALNSGQSNVLDNELRMKCEHSYHNSQLWGDRPGTAMDNSVDVS